MAAVRGDDSFEVTMRTAAVEKRLDSIMDRAAKASGLAARRKEVMATNFDSLD